MFGVINVVTRSGPSVNGSEIGLSFGSGADRRLRAELGRPGWRQGRAGLGHRFRDATAAR
jgi:hypothetical protein